jgi:hypothetical protein
MTSLAVTLSMIVPSNSNSSSANGGPTKCTDVGVGVHDIAQDIICSPLCISLSMFSLVTPFLFANTSFVWSLHEKSYINEVISFP